MLVAPIASQAATSYAFSPGDLIKGSGPAVYYFGQDGRRYVFPNDKAYFTWYTDFSKVKTIPNNVLSTLPLGRSNVTYRPGKKMIKIQSDPRTYAVDQGGVLRLVTSEQLAQTLYGLNWKGQIDDIADAFFINYRIGNPIQTQQEYNPANVMTLTTTISQDKQFDETTATVTVGDQNVGYVPTTLTVKRGTNVTFTNNDIVAHKVIGATWESPSLEYGQSFTKKFDTVGSFEYHDNVKTSIVGTINIVN